MSKETLSFDTETEKVFQLMIHSLYEHKEIFLRELISNASDACDKLRYEAITKPEWLENDPELRIIITPDKEAGTLTIHDNGVGMSRSELIKNLGTIARSGTQQFAEKLTGDKKKDAQLIGQFGVGFYSSFMVADKVSVISRAAGGKKAYLWQSDGSAKFTIEEAKDEQPRGTTITLHLKEDEKEYLDFWRIKHVVDTYSNHIGIPIVVVNEEGEEETVNDGKALWTLPKSEISEEEYTEFYRNIAAMGNDTPWLTLHTRAEGALEYTTLLYVPSQKPFDLFHPERQTRVKLYIKRVFIADDSLELVPRYLRFLRGIVDSEDLPLNISRETVQNSVVLAKIRRNIVKKVLSELDKKAEKDPEEYTKFWANFGPVLKEGLCDGMEPRDEIIEVCRFRTLNHGEKLMSLKQVKAEMKEGQESLYFISADSYEKALASPQVEGFKARGVDVVVLTDPVDDFWVNVLHEYQGTPLKSVTRASTDLDAIPLKNGKSKDKKSENKQEDKKDNSENSSGKNKADNDALLAFMKQALGERVQDVRVSSRLAESPVCLTVAEGAMDIRMERFLVENNQLPQTSKKILEVNPDHPVVRKLASDMTDKTHIKRAEDTVHLLFAQANIIEGEPVDDVAGFTRRMNALLEEHLAA